MDQPGVSPGALGGPSTDWGTEGGVQTDPYAARKVEEEEEETEGSDPARLRMDGVVWSGSGFAAIAAAAPSVSFPPRVSDAHHPARKKFSPLRLSYLSYSYQITSP